MKKSFPLCPLCASENTAAFCERRDSSQIRFYFKCTRCSLVFLSPAQRLSCEEEKKHYDSHRNDPGDERYLEFLNRLAAPLSLKLKPGTEGIDYGCGPGPAMSLLFRKKGFEMKDYDPLYFPEPDLMNRTYDFAACSEAAEHFREPGKEFAKLDQLLHKGGWLGIMTGLLEDESAFAGWWYPKDPTHICFYQKATLEFIAAAHRWTLELPAPNIILFQKT